MLKIRYRNKFKKDLKKVLSQGHKIDELQVVLDLLVQQISLPEKYCDHALIGNYVGYRECHIRPDWLLIYKVENDILTLTLT